MESNKNYPEDKSTTVFATRFRSMVDAKEINQTDLAKAIHKTRQSISQYMWGKSQPSLENLVILADMLETSTDYLLGRTDDPNIQSSIIDDTGLSNDVIIKLKQLKASQENGYYELSLINTLLSCPKLDDVLNAVEDYFASVHAKEIFKHHHSSIITTANKIEYEYSFPELCLLLAKVENDEYSDIMKQYIEEAKQYYDTIIGIIHSGQYNKLISHHLLKLLNSVDPHQSNLDYIYACKALESLKYLKDYIYDERMKIIKETLLSTKEVENLDTIALDW